jgi:hypothetical protein
MPVNVGPPPHPAQDEVVLAIQRNAHLVAVRKINERRMFFNANVFRIDPPFVGRYRQRKLRNKEAFVSDKKRDAAHRAVDVGLEIDMALSVGVLRELRQRCKNLGFNAGLGRFKELRQIDVARAAHGLRQHRVVFDVACFAKDNVKHDGFSAPFFQRLDQRGMPAALPRPAADLANAVIRDFDHRDARVYDLRLL